MSRRPRQPHPWIRPCLIGLAAGLLLLAATSSLALRQWLHSESFRTLLSREAARAAGVEGGFSSLQWDGLALDARSFEGSGTGVIRELKIEGLHTEVGLGGFWRGCWELRDSMIQRIDLTLGAMPKRLEEPTRPPDPSPPAAVGSAPPRPSRQRTWLPQRIESGGIGIRDLSVSYPHDRGVFALRGTRIAATQETANRSWRIDAQGGLLETPLGWMPVVRLDQLKGRWNDGVLNLGELRATAWDDAILAVGGEWRRDPNETMFDGSLTGIRCEALLPPDWSKHLQGSIDSTFAFRHTDGRASAEGTIDLRRGLLSALPFLDALDAYADTGRFRHLDLTEARADWMWERGQITLRNIVIASEGLVQLEGECMIRGRALDGRFRLGIAPGTLRRIPGAESRVFQPGTHGLLWSPLRLSGTLDEPREDLSERLIAEAGVRMIEQLPESVFEALRLDSDAIQRDPQPHIDQIRETLRDGSRAIEEVESLIDGILKSRKQKKGAETESPARE